MSLQKILQSRNLLFLGLSMIVIGVLLMFPTGFENALQFKDAVKCKVEILEVDDSSIIDTGLIRTGQQVCKVRFLNGRFKNQYSEGWNMLGGSLSLDKVFHKGDYAQAVVHCDDSEIISVNLIDYYRLDGELFLALAFAVFLFVFARGIGIRSVLSFIITILVMWKIVVRMCLWSRSRTSGWMSAGLIPTIRHRS